MDTALWLLQIVLAIKFISVAYTHGLRPNPTKLRSGRRWLGAFERPVMIATALAAFAGGVALILPAVAGSLSWLISWAAAFLALMMLPATVLHIQCRKTPHTVVSAILFLLAAFVAYGRWVVVPS